LEVFGRRFSVTRGTAVPLTPEEIKAQKFPVALRGYEKEDVDEFLQRVAADYESALAAFASAGDPYAAVGREVGAVLRSAKQSAQALRDEAAEETGKMRREAAEEAVEVRRRAAEEAAATLEGAREKAMTLGREAERLVKSAKEQARAAREQADEETDEVRRQASEEGAATLEQATAKAEEVTIEAERRARRVRETAERTSDEMLKDATERHRYLRSLETELEERIESVGKALNRLRAELSSRLPEDSSATARDAKVSAEPDAADRGAASEAVAARLKGLDPELDQVAETVSDDVWDAHEARDSVTVQPPKDESKPGPKTST
jgi:DivIVA domain-containing protein